MAVKENGTSGDASNNTNRGYSHSEKDVGESHDESGSDTTLMEKELRDLNEHIKATAVNDDDNVEARTDENEVKRHTLRGDEYEIDFGDTREFAASRWSGTVEDMEMKVSETDPSLAVSHQGWQDLTNEIQTKVADPASTSLMKREMKRILPFPRALVVLTTHFDNLINPSNADFGRLWGLMSYTSPERLKRIIGLLDRLRKVMELFNRCLRVCEEPNEARIAMADFLDPLVNILTDSIIYLHIYCTDLEAQAAWPDLNGTINDQMSDLEGLVKHLDQINSYSRVNQDSIVKNISQRHALIPEDEETARFPIHKLPFRSNPNFYGREEELKKINDYLSPKGDGTLRSYTIYGRRGVGKTEIAQQFARTNKDYDAIFWIQCETSVSIRQSFSDVAIALNLPGAERDGHHEENLVAVHKWLKKTTRRWLLIFDNAERDSIIQGYWPAGAPGAILITSRRYHNFIKDQRRMGDTVKPFNLEQSWALLFRILGKGWQKQEREGRISIAEEQAAKEMLQKLEGLALAIQQAAILIQNPAIGGPTIAKTYAMFLDKMRTLPPRHASERSASEKALDALWDMIFTSLNNDARALLGVLAWLSPDDIRVDVFMPANQEALNGPLAFCKQDTRFANGQASVLSASAPSAGFERAIGELVEKELVRRDGLVLSIHRVVQEAVNYHDADDLQVSFHTASRLIYEAFPKMRNEDSLYNEWSICQAYITHGVILSKRYFDHQRSTTLKGSNIFVKLLTSCAWYLYEVGDFVASAKVTETAISACDDKKSLDYASLVNINGSRFLDLNRLLDCRKAWELVLRIRKDRLHSHSDELMAATYHNLGNLETASGNLQVASEYYERATLIWNAGGESTGGNSALTYLCWGRVYMLRGELKSARKMVQKADIIYTRRTGADKGMMAHVHYAYGNIDFREKQWQQAYRSWESCLKISLVETPIHPLTVAAYFSLGVAEMNMKHFDPARGLFEKARLIAELRSPTRDDGPITRIIWMTSKLLESDPYGSYAKEAAELRTRAEVSRQTLLSNGEGGFIPLLDENDIEQTEEESEYDALVPLYYR